MFLSYSVSFPKISQESYFLFPLLQIHIFSSMLNSRSSSTLINSALKLRHFADFCRTYHHGPQKSYSRKSSDKFSRQKSRKIAKLHEHIPFLDEIKQCEDPDEALALFYDYQEKGVKHDYPFYSSLIYKLARARNFEAVETLLGSLKKYNIRCKESLFIALFEHYCNASLSGKAIELFRDMTSFNCVRRLQCFNAILNCLIDSDCLSDANDIFMSSSKMGFRLNSVSFNIMIKMWLRNGEWDRAQKMFDEMLVREVEPTVVTYNSLIGFLCKRDELDKAKNLFKDMVEKGKRPNAVSYALLMEGLCSVGKFKEAKKLMFDMEYQACKARLVNYGVLMTDLGKRGEFDEAKGLLAEMKKKKIRPDVVIFNILINYYCRKEKVTEAYKILLEMQFEGCKPNAASYRMMVDGFCRVGEFEDGLKVLNVMLNSRHLPRSETFFCLFLGLARSGNLDNACYLLEEMEKREIWFDLKSWEALVLNFCQEQEVVHDFIAELIGSS